MFSYRLHPPLFLFAMYVLPETGDNGPAKAGLLNTPTGLAVDAANNLYISDRGESFLSLTCVGSIEHAWQVVHAALSHGV
jgi:hypothetical protein